MKRKLFLLAMLVFSSVLLAQTQSISISGSSSVEVGVPNNYTFTFNPDYIGNTQDNTGLVPDGYVITGWIVTTGTAAYSGQFTGYVGSSGNQTNYYSNPSLNGPNPLSIPIQWGDGTYTRNDIIEVKLNGYYKKNSTGVITKYINFLTNTKEILVNRIEGAMIGGNTSVLNCDQTNATYSVINDTYANVFSWEVTNGGQIIGSSTGTSVNVKPPIAGDFNVSCTVKRSGGNQNYFKTSSKNITRTSRTAPSFTVLYPDFPNSPPPFNFFCKSTGRQLSLPSQSGIVNINWVANGSGCTFTGQNTLTPTISSSTGGGIVDVYATIQFDGGCTATTPAIAFVITDETPPLSPSGTLSFVPYSTDPCIDNGYMVKFTPSSSYSNGKITVSPSSIPPGWNSFLFGYTITYTNFCTSASSSTVIMQNSPPAVNCYRMSSSPEEVNIVVSPNPTEGRIEVVLPEILTGMYQIVDPTGNLVQEAKFKNISELKIELSGKLKSGIYILKILSESATYTNKIILNK